MVEFGKYAKIVILSTLAEKKTLVDMSITWFNNKGRLYQPKILKEIKKAIEDKWIIQEGKFYKANTKKLIQSIVNEIILGENNKLSKRYQQELAYFYFNLGEYTQKVYLNFDVIKAITGLNYRKINEININLILQLPFFLRYVEYKDQELANIFIQVMNLENYVVTIEKLEIQHYDLLKSKRLIDAWVETFEKLTRLLPKMQKKNLTIFKKNIQAMKALGG